MELNPFSITFLIFWTLLVGQRLYELRISKRNEKNLLSRGGKYVNDPVFPFMKLFHTAWFIFVGIEFFIEGRVLNISLFFPFILLFFVGQVLRIAAIKTLDQRWSVRIIVLPGKQPEMGGIYQYIRHPNYLGVILEIMAFPLAFGLFYSAAIFSLLNLIVVLIRIKDEEKALNMYNGYLSKFKNTMRFVPRKSR